MLHNLVAPHRFDPLRFGHSLTHLCSYPKRNFTVLEKWANEGDVEPFKTWAIQEKLKRAEDSNSLQTVMFNVHFPSVESVCIMTQTGLRFHS